MAITLTLIPSTGNLANLKIIKSEGVGSNGLVFTTFDGKNFRICTKERFVKLNELASADSMNANNMKTEAVRQKYLSHTSPFANVKDLIVVKPMEKKNPEVKIEVAESISKEAVAQA
jgi:uncharacterized protein (DUF1919 family)